MSQTLNRLKKKKKITIFGQPTSLIARGRASATLPNVILVKVNVSDLQTDRQAVPHLEAGTKSHKRTVQSSLPEMRKLPSRARQVTGATWPVCFPSCSYSLAFHTCTFQY